jgi:L-lactate dehydrogenase
MTDLGSADMATSTHENEPLVPASARQDVGSFGAPQGQRAGARSDDRSTVGVIGAGKVGAAVANALALMRSCDRIVLYNRGLARAEGQAWDISDGTALLHEIELLATDDWNDLAGVDVAIVTLGQSNHPGESRLEIDGNDALIRHVMERLDEVAPDAVVVIVSNPVDVLTRLAIECSSRPWQRIFGSGTVLDGARLRRSLGSTLGVDPQSVHVPVLGEHGDSSVIAWSAAAIGPIPLKAFPHPKAFRLDDVKQRCLTQMRRRGVHDILTRKGYTDAGIAAVVCRLVEAVLRNERRIFTASTRALPEYHIGEHVVLGLPCVLGRDGIMQRLPLTLDAEEQRLLARSAAILEGAYESLARSIPAQA